MPHPGALVVLALAGMLALTWADPGVLYVGPGGSDSPNNCQSTSSPCASISYALTMATVNPTTVILKQGEYIGSLNRNLAGPGNVSLQYVGETPGTATVDCGNPSPGAFGFQVGNSGIVSYFMNFTSFRIKNCNLAAIIAPKEARVVITDMEFINNTNYAGDQIGGALNLVPTSKPAGQYSVVITNSRFISNGAQLGGAIGAKAYNIGLLDTRAPVNVQITGCTFTSNVASQYGGAIYMNDPDRLGNTYTSPLLTGSSIASSTFTRNSAAQNGGAVYLLPGSLGQQPQAVSTVPDFRDNVFTGNSVSNCEAQCGTAWYMNTETLWQFSNNTFANNVGTGTVAGSMTAGALMLRLCDPFTLVSSTFTNNNATNSDSGAQSSIVGAGLAIFQSADYNMTLTGTNTFTGNKNYASISRSPAIGNSGGGRPYGTLYNAAFSDNAAKEGGAWALTPGGSGVTFESTSFSGNQASVGGALYLNGGNVVFSNCIFRQNAVSLGLSFGGAIYMIGSTTTFTAPQFLGNAGGHGAAVFADAGQQTSITVTEGVFSTNRASGKGGALYVGAQPGTVMVSGKTSVQLSGTDFLYNSAGQGGAIYAQSSFMLDIDSSQLIGNLADYTLAQAATAGGAVFIKGAGNATMAALATARFSNVYMDLNVANVTYTAGAIRCEGASFSVNTTIFQIQPCCGDRCIGCDTVCAGLFSPDTNITCPQKVCPSTLPAPTAAPLPAPGAAITPPPTDTPAPDFTYPPFSYGPTTAGTTAPPKKSNKIIGLKPIIFWTCVVGLPALVIFSLLVASILCGFKSGKKGPKGQSRRSMKYSQNVNL